MGNKGLLVSEGERKVRTRWDLQHHRGQKYALTPKGPLGRGREGCSEGCLAGPALPCCCQREKGRVGVLVHPHLLWVQLWSPFPCLSRLIREELPFTAAGC